MQTELVHVRDRETSEKTSWQHQSPSPRKQPEPPSTGGGKALGWHIRDTETNLSSRKRHKRAPAAQHTYTKFQTHGSHAPRASCADRKLIEVLKIQDPVKFQKQGSGCTVTLTHSFSEKTPAHDQLPTHACRAGRTRMEAKVSQGLRHGTAEGRPQGTQTSSQAPRSHAAQ